MRAFIAIDFSSETKYAISSLQAKLRPYATCGRWKYTDNFHLTLKFLDEIDDNTVEKIGQALSRVCKERGGFTMSISDIGNFPGKDCLRVLWLSLGGETDKLRNLQRDIEDELYGIGFPKEKRVYVPHVTIAQDVSFSVQFSNIVKIAEEVEFPDIQVDKIHLFKSEQIGRKRVYTPMCEYVLEK